MQFVLLLLSVLLPSSALLHSLLLAYSALLHRCSSPPSSIKFNEDGMPLLVAALLGTHSSLLVEVCISVLSTSV